MMSAHSGYLGGSKRWLGWLLGICLALQFGWVTNARGQIWTIIYTVSKTRIFEQTTPGLPVLDSPTPFLFEAVVQPDIYQVIGGTVTPPGRPPLTLTLEPGGAYFQYVAYRATQAALEADFPAGTYQANVATDGGNETPSIGLPATAYPNPPTVTNYAEAQEICPVCDFHLEWLPFISPGDAGSIVVSIFDSAGATVLQTAPGDLPTTATSLLIPHHSLAANQTYRAAIVFQRGVDLDIGFFSPLSQSSVITTTLLTLKTIPAVPAGVSIEVTTAPGSPYFSFKFNSEAGRTYEIQASPNLVTWTPLAITSSTECFIEYTDFATPSFLRRFYKVIRQ